MSIQAEIERELKRIQAVSGRGLLQIDRDAGRIEADLLAVDAIGCSFQTLGFSTQKLADASLDELKSISETLTGKLTYLLEPIGVVEADADQLEQALINLVKNAVDASEGKGRVLLRWRGTADGTVVEVLDEGPGIANPDNLFVPFFTTKPGGSGIGLVLSRQIVEGHGGTLTLENRNDARGCVARVRLV